MLLEIEGGIGYDLEHISHAHIAIPAADLPEGPMRLVNIHALGMGSAPCPWMVLAVLRRCL
jgi:hypothetical protein